jgi:D-alanine-D-alanine ligase
VPAKSLVILHDSVPAGAPPDQADTLAQVQAVSAALRQLGIDSVALAFEPRLPEMTEKLAHLQPAGVFNLVESVAGNDALAHLVPAWLESLGMPCTGASAVSMLVSNEKRYAKRLMNASGIVAPADFPGVIACPPDSRWIVKSLQMHASLGLDDSSVVAAQEVPARLARAQRAHGGLWFAERYIEGREFNLALLQDGAGARVLPAAEIVFTGYAAGRARIVDYRAKWAPESFEYRNTRRAFPTQDADGDLLDRLSEIALACWQLLECRGYARVDLRVDAAGQPWVLEVNANPCLAPDAGFAAALEQAGLDFTGAIGAIIESAGIHAASV